MSLIERIRSDVEGAKILYDWLGDGSPVNPMVAEARAACCAMGNDGKPCPLNTAPDWWDKVKHKIADWIKAELELKTRLDLTTAVDGELHMCAACGCCTRLKVWTPTIHLKAHLNQKQLDKTPAYCWMRKELHG